MENSMIISEINAVFSGENRKGILDNSHKQREYDGLVYYLSGEVEYIFSDHSFTAKAGSVAYLPRHSSYVMNVKEDFSYVCVNFTLLPPTSARRGFCVLRGIPPSTQNDLLRIGALLGAADAGSLSECFSLLYRVLSTVQRANLEYKPKDDRIVRAVSFIRMSYANPELLVADVACEVGVCESHLRRMFRSFLGISPIQYIKAVRIEAARNLLIDTNLPLTDVATAVGYTDTYYFIREFSATVGTSPGRFRANKRTGEK